MWIKDLNKFEHDLSKKCLVDNVRMAYWINGLFILYSATIIYIIKGSIGIAPTRDCTHFLKFRFVVAVGRFYSYYINQGNKLDKERKIVRKKWVLCIQKDLINFWKYGCNSTSTIKCIKRFIKKGIERIRK